MTKFYILNFETICALMVWLTLIDKGRSLRLLSETISEKFVHLLLNIFPPYSPLHKTLGFSEFCPKTWQRLTKNKNFH